MLNRKWTVILSSEVRKSTKAGKKKRGLPLYVLDALKALIMDIEYFGPTLGKQAAHWPHFSSLGKGKYHCHLLKSKAKKSAPGKNEKGPCYVACWVIEDKKLKITEVYYVGSHENAPY